MNLLSKIWLQAAFLFDPVQYFFNGNFWNVFIEKFGKLENSSVIDIACGTGELALYISPKNYLGIDINPAYIEYAKKRFKEKNFKFILADATEYNFTKDYDKVFLISAAHHLSDDLISNLCQNIKDNGIKEFIIIDGYPVGFFAPVLRFLDGFLGGGKYFRNENQISKILQKYFTVKQKGILKAKDSFYDYPYVIVNR